MDVHHLLSFRINRRQHHLPITMTNHKPATSSSKADTAEEPVPSYETALREGAGGGVGGSAGPSHSTASAPQAQPTYGCSPYTPHGTTRIIIVPAPQWHQHSHQPLLPAPATMETVAVRRAAPRFFLALLQAFMIYLLINLLVDLTVTRKW